MTQIIWQSFSNLFTLEYINLTLRDLWRHWWWRHQSPRVSTTHIFSIPLFIVQFSWDFYTQRGSQKVPIFIWFWHWGTCDVTDDDDVINLREWVHSYIEFSFIYRPIFMGFQHTAGHGQKVLILFDSKPITQKKDVALQTKNAITLNSIDTAENTWPPW